MYNQSISDLNILKQEMLATRATWKEWLAASDSCKPVIPGVAIQQGRSLGKLAGWGYLAPTKKSNISSDSPAHKNIARVNTKAAPDQFMTH